MSPRRPILITCTFCGDADVRRAVEDVIPNWLADKMAHYCRLALGENAKPRYVNFTYDSPDQLLADRAAGTVGANATGRNVIGERPVGYKLPDVCETCNRGWMGQLEDTAKLRLIPGFLDGKTKALDPYDQLVLSMWIIKTSLTYDACQQTRSVPGEHGSRLLYSTGQPLRYTQVLIGHIENLVMDGEILHGIDTRHFNPTGTHCPAVSIWRCVR